MGQGDVKLCKAKKYNACLHFHTPLYYIHPNYNNININVTRVVVDEKKLMPMYKYLQEQQNNFLKSLIDNKYTNHSTSKNFIFIGAYFNK